jgi:phosphonatase-like hydrolase
MAPVSLIVMDMAGTTVTDNKEVETCFARAAKQTGLEMTDAEILSVQGWAKRKVFEVYWERQLGDRNNDWATKVENSFVTFKEILEQHYSDNDVIPTEGCISLLEFLREQKIPVALTTGFYRDVSNIILGKLGWLDGLDQEHIGRPGSLISMSITSDEVPEGRPAPDMIFKAMRALGVADAKNVINIGDTPSDIESGHRAGTFSACVTNGTHPADILMESQPDQAFSGLPEFQSWLKGLIIK